MLQPEAVDVQIYSVPYREVWAAPAAAPLRSRLEVLIDRVGSNVRLDRESAGWSSLSGTLAFDYVHGSRLGQLRTGMLAGRPLIRSTEIEELADRVLAARGTSAGDPEAWAERLAREASEAEG